MRPFWRRLLLLVPWRQRAAERDMREELRALAALAGRGELGNLTRAAEEARAQWHWRGLDELTQDLRYAARSLRRNPLFTAVAIVTLGVGIGAATTTFSVVRAVLLRPLPYAAPDRLLAVAEPDTRTVPTVPTVASADLDEWQRLNSVFTEMAGYGGLDERGKSHWDLYLTQPGGTTALKGLSVYGDLFGVLGVRSALGRTFDPQEFHDGQEHGVVLSDRCWRAHFGADPTIVGRHVTLSGVDREVIGVMPRGFFFPDRTIDVYLVASTLTSNRYWHDMGAIARLRPGVTLERARADIAAIGAGLQHAHPRSNASLRTSVVPWQSSLAGSRGTAALLLFGAAGVLFAIVCSNLAHLQLGRAASRTMEFAVRAALGADRWRLVRQVLTEGVLLSALGGACGYLVTLLAHRAVARTTPTALPFYADLRLDGPVVLFGVGTALVAPILFALGPALISARPGRAGWQVRRPGVGTGRGRSLLVAGEVALSVALTICAGLLVNSLLRLDRVDLGFRPEHTLSFRINLDSFVPQSARAAHYAAIERSLRDQPAIDAAGGTNRPVLGGGSGGNAGVTIRGRQYALRLDLVTPGYLSAMEVPVVRGTLPAGPSAGSGIAVVVNEAFEHRYFPSGALGGQIGLGPRGTATILAVVADLKQDSVRKAPEPAAFLLSSPAFTPGGGMTFIVRGGDDEHALSAAVHRAVRAVDSVVPVENEATLGSLARASTADTRVDAWVSRPLPPSRSCSRPSVSTACWRTRSSNDRPRSAFGARSGRPARRFSGCSSSMACGRP